MQQTSIFPRELHIFDWHDKSQYPFQIHKEPFVCLYPGDKKCGAFPIVAPLTYRTDLASIPTRALRKILDRSKFVRTDVYTPGLAYAVWIYRDFLDGAGPRIVGYRLSPLAYCAVVHDVICSTEMMSAWAANRIFGVLMGLTGTEGRDWIYAGVQVGCWVTYLQHDHAEVQEDRAMVRAATLEWLKTNGKEQRCLI